MILTVTVGHLPHARTLVQRQGIATVGIAAARVVSFASLARLKKRTPTTSMPSKGLPGFLRRSLRRDFEQEDEQERQSVSNHLNSSLGNKLSNVVVPDPGANNDDTSNNDSNNDIGNGNDSGPLDHDNEESPSNGDALKMEDYDHKIAPLAALDSSMSTLASSPDNNLSDNDNGNESSTVPKYNYRETQFEKTISADVVKMIDLRNLSWNGVPVSNNQGIVASD